MDAEEVQARYQAARRKQMRSVNLWLAMASLAGLIATMAVFVWLWANGVIYLQLVYFMLVCAVALGMAVWGYIKGAPVANTFDPLHHE